MIEKDKLIRYGWITGIIPLAVFLGTLFLWPVFNFSFIPAYFYKVMSVLSALVVAFSMSFFKENILHNAFTAVAAIGFSVMVVVVNLSDLPRIDAFLLWIFASIGILLGLMCIGVIHTRIKIYILESKLEVRKIKTSPKETWKILLTEWILVFGAMAVGIILL